METVVLNPENFEKEVLKEENLTLVDFYAKWCSPCKLLSPIVDEFSQNTDIKVCKADVDVLGKETAMLGIMGVPTLVLFKNGEVVAKQVGFINEDELREFVDSNR